jgi:hypothetical protein
LKVNSLGLQDIEFIISIRKDRIYQLNSDYIKDRPRYRTQGEYLQEEENKKTEVSRPPPLPKPFGISQFAPPPLPFDGSVKKEEEKKGPSALERALMESHENQESSTLEKLVQEKVGAAYWFNC